MNFIENNKINLNTTLFLCPKGPANISLTCNAVPEGLGAVCARESAANGTNRVKSIVSVEAVVSNPRSFFTTRLCLFSFNSEYNTCLSFIVFPSLKSNVTFLFSNNKPSPRRMAK